MLSTIKSSPALAAPLIPKISTGVEGEASFIFIPLSFTIALTFPHLNPLTKKSPFFNVPVVTIIVATGPLPISIFDSKTIPVAFDSKSVFKSNISACKIIASINFSKFNFSLQIFPPLEYLQINLQQLTHVLIIDFYFLRISFRQITFINSNHYRDFCCFCMFNRLNSLWFYSIICSYN